VSIQAVGWVLEHSTTRMADRLVLLAIANHAGTSPVDGAWEAWPGVALIAEEANLAPRVVQVSLARLEGSGVIERVLNGAPDGRVRGGYRPNLYRIITTPRGESSVHPSAGETPEDLAQPGVHANDTPAVPRGESSRRRGVYPHDVEGCRRTTPKPSVEPSMNQPPSPEPRELPPADDPSGGVETIHQPPGLAATADQRRERIRAACMLIAARLAEHRPDLARPARWIAAAADRLTGQHATAGHRHLTDHPDLTPQALADLLERPPGSELNPDQQRARQREREEATQRHIRDTLAQPGDRIRSAERARQLRESLGRPQQETTDA